MQSAETTNEIRRELLEGSAALAERVRRQVRWQAVLVVVAISLAALLVIVFIDFGMRREELGLRWLFSLLWISIVGVSYQRWILPAWRFNPSPTEMARWIEQNGERSVGLTTAVQLAAMETDQRMYGSPEFRDSALLQWRERSPAIQWQHYQDDRPWWRVLGAVAATCGIGILLLCLWPATGWLGLQRFALPWLERPWPRADQLVLVDVPSTVAVGTELQIEIRDLNGPPPDPVQVLTRTIRRPKDVTTIKASFVGDLAVSSIPVIEEALEIRAVGGEDQNMPWHRIDVVNPPRLEAHRFRIEPPAYSVQPARELTTRRVQVLAGSKVSFEGQLSESVRQIGIKLVQGRQSANPELARQWAQQVTVRMEDSSDKFQMLVDGASSWIPPDSVAWQLVVTLDGGLQLALPDYWSIEVVTDSAPSVQLAEIALQDVTTRLMIPLRGMATDDLGLANVLARAEVLGDADDPNSTVVAEAASKELWLSKGENRRDVTADTVWDLAELKIAEGQRLAVWLTAEDTNGQTGSSRPRTFRVRSPDDFVRSIQMQQQDLARQLEELVQSQRRNRQLADQTATTIRGQDAATTSEVDALASVRQIQNSINGMLSGQPDALVDELGTLREALTQNGLGLSPLAIQLEELENSIRGAAEGVAREALRDAAESQRLAQDARQGALDEALLQALLRSSDSQRASYQALRAIADRMSELDQAQRMQQQLADVEQRQRALQQDTQSLRNAELAGETGQALERATEALANQQMDLARELEQWAEQESAIEPNGAAGGSAISRAIEQITEQRVSSQMREASRDLQSGQLQGGADAQEQILKALQSAMGQWNEKQSDQARWSRESQLWEQVANNLQELANEQSRLADEFANAVQGGLEGEELERPRADQAGVRGRTEEQTNMANRLGDDNLSRQLEEAVAQQRSAEQALAESDPQNAASRGQEAARVLKEAAKRASQQSSMAENQAQQAEAFELAQAIENLVRQQEPIVGALQRLSDQSRENPGEEIASAAADVARNQDQVRESLLGVETKTTALPAFAWLLSRTDNEMARASAAAQRMLIDPDALEAASNALHSLQMASRTLQEDLASRSDEDTSQENAENSAGDTQEDDRESRLVSPLTSLRLLRELQADVNQQTVDLNNRATSAVDRARRLQQLTQDQRALAQHVQALLRELAAASDTNE